MYLSLVPAMHPAVAAAIAPAAPDVTMPDSAPVSSDNFRPAPRCSSIIFTKYCAASTWATDFGELERTAEIGPRTSAIDHRFHA